LKVVLILDESEERNCVEDVSFLIQTGPVGLMAKESASL
jgi:hypothetical protein